MPIPTQCSCGGRFTAPDKLAGRKVKCPKCSQPVRVGTPDGGTKAVPRPIGVKCQCGKPFRVPGKLAGKAAKCPECGDTVRVPKPAGSAASAIDRASDLVTEEGVANLLDEADLILSKTGRRCPECRQDLQLDDVICVKCGYNTETGKKIKVKKLEQGGRVGNVVPHEGAPAAKKEIPSTVQSLIKLLNQSGMLAALTGVLVVAFLGYQKMQSDPNLGVDAFSSVLTGTGGYVLGTAILLVTVPCKVAANLVQERKPAGRILSIVAGFTSLLAIPIVTLFGILILKLAFSDDLEQYCR